MIRRRVRDNSNIYLKFLEFQVKSEIFFCYYVKPALFISFQAFLTFDASGPPNTRAGTKPYFNMRGWKCTPNTLHTPSCPWMIYGQDSENLIHSLLFVYCSSTQHSYLERTHWMCNLGCRDQVTLDTESATMYISDFPASRTVRNKYLFFMTLFWVIIL